MVELLTDEQFEKLIIEKFSRKEFRAVQDICVSVLEKQPRNAAAWVFLGETLEEQGFTNDAWASFDRGWMLDPQADWVTTVKTRLKLNRSKSIQPWLKNLLSVPKKTLTAALITKNEERTIGEAIHRLVNAVDEVVVIDTGSTDQTIHIAQEAGAKIYSFTWRDDFSAARNYALSNVTSDWVLFVDADELLYEEDIPVPRIVAGLYDNCSPPPILRIGQMNSNGPHTHENYDMCRFFPTRFGIKWWGRIHEQLGSSHGNLYTTPFVREAVRIRFLHDGYEPKIFSAKKKQQRNISLLEKSVAENPDDIGSWGFLGREWIIAGDLEKAISILYKTEELAPRFPTYARLTEVRKFLVEALLRSGRLEEASSVARRSVKDNPDFPQGWYDLARTNQAIASHLLNEATQCYLKSLESISDYRGMVSYDSEIPIWKANAGLAEISGYQGEWLRSVSLFQRCAAVLPSHTQIQNHLTKLVNEAQQIVSLDQDV